MLNLAAINKLKDAMKKVNDPSIGRVVDFLIKRINEDEGLGNDVLKDGKSLAGCWNYVKSEARKSAVNGVACIEDAQVYEWAEDYFRNNEPDPKPVTKTESKSKAPAKGKAKTSAKPVASPTPTPSPDTVDDQINLFDDRVDESGDVWLF